MQSNFFAVVLNPSTQAESTGFENSQFQVPMARKPAGNCSKLHITGSADPHTAGNEDGGSFQNTVQNRETRNGNVTATQKFPGRKPETPKIWTKIAPEWHIKSAR